VNLNRRSAHITEGVARAPNRSMFYALGYEEGDFHKPLVGVANAHSTITPCNAGLQRLADNVSERTVSRYLRGLPSRPERRQNWRTFMKNHREVIAAMDFFTVPTASFRLL
jgi:hypothetical protein